MAKEDRIAKRQATGSLQPTAADLLRDALSRSYDSRIVFGEPVVVGDRAVIPAARVSAGGGGGFGAAPSDEGPGSSPDEGAGMGHGVHARPAGYIDVGPEGSRWVPAIDITAILVAGTIALGMLAFAWCFRRRPCRRLYRRLYRRSRSS